MERYFKNVKTLEQLRKQYRDLLKQYPPDNSALRKSRKQSA